uniref:Secreted ookinete protein n=1 Tax=Parastrongyloides trichosuri TaxID=131310 RepID=A0A0N4ZK78_PARTI
MKVNYILSFFVIFILYKHSSCKVVMKREISGVEDIYTSKDNSLTESFSKIIGDNSFLKGVVSMIENVSQIIMKQNDEAKKDERIHLQDTKTEVLNEPIPIKGSNKEELIENYKKIFNKNNNNKKDIIPNYSLSIDETPEEVVDKDADLSYLVSKEHWTKLLFGPTGLFTEVMKQFKDVRKQELAKARSANTHPSSDSINSQVGSQKDPFTKIVEAIFSAPRDKEFNEPLPELPLIGVCNRLNCGQIYNAIDSFRRSEMFSNLQTAVSLMGDEKGLDMLTEFMSNPQLISQFTGGGSESLAKLFGFGGSPGGDIKEKGIKEGELGTDLSELIDKNGKEMYKPDKTALPEIAENIDYYSSVDKGDEEIDGPVSVTKEEVVNNKGELKKETKIDKDYYEEVNLGNSNEEKENVGESSKITSSRVIESSNLNNKSTFGKEEIVISELPEISANIDEYGETFEKIENIDSAMTNQAIKATIKVSTTTTTKPSAATTRKLIINRLKQITRSSPKPMPRRIVTTRKTTKLPTTTIPTTTKRNFRKDSDYYSMYYDDQH